MSVGGEKSAVWSFDFGLRVSITAIEAQQKMQVSPLGYAKPTINSLWPHKVIQPW